VKQAVDWQRELYETKAGELILYGRALGLGHSEAEDVLQETFVALLKMERVPDNPLHYCIRGFRNRALNYRRGLMRRIVRELESKSWFERTADESPHERAAMQCLQKLPPDQREVIVLKIWHEHTFEEIGELLELSPNTVAGRYRYGMEKLRACLKKERQEDRETRRQGEEDDSVALSPCPPVPLSLLNGAQI
jgi:RNA polymerase sigma-70 factor (ECF subfamily)